jgi:predicted acetyltransferase
VFGWRRDRTLRLILPDVAWESRYLAAVIEYRRAGLVLNHDYPDDGEPFAYFCHRLRQPELAPDMVPYTVYWLVEDRTFIGRLCLRHALTPALSRHGGHIGYVVRPSRWRQGYGTRLLALGLAEAAKLGLDRVLITCDAGNAGSQRVIERNGGVYADQIGNERRYWIALGRPGG